MIVALRDRLRAGDVWLEGSRAFRAFDDFLLPPAAFAAKRQAGELGLAVPDRFDAWRDERLETLKRRLREVATLASAGKLPEALITEAGLSISPIRKNDTDVDDIARRLYGMLPRVRITELLAEVHGHIGPLGWEHISFNGDYVWPSEPFKDGFRPLRNPRSAFLDAA